MRLLAERLGYRGLALLIFGLIYGVLGYSVWANPEPMPELLHTHLPLWLRLAIWCGAGGVAVAVAVCVFLNANVARLERVAFGLLIVGPILRCTSFLWAVIAGSGLMWLAGVAVWLLLIALVSLVAAWPEPPKPQPALRESP